MDFANAMKEEGKFTRTENGAVALSTTSDARLMMVFWKLSMIPWNTRGMRYSLT